MIGAIAGDIIGSVYEGQDFKSTRFRLFHPRCRFTDDTVLTVALADSILHGTDYVTLLKQYYRAYPRAGAFFELKRQHDPGGLFRNRLYEKYS